jgi:ParB-like chromosome segregation protein Spo0J
MRVLNSTTKTEPIDAIKPHPQNPRQGDIGAIHQSIQTNGFYGTIIAQKSTGYILAGNHRWQAARQTKTKTIPVTWLDVDDDHALRILLADNRTNDLATYNDNMLSELLQDLHNATGTLDGTGYTGDDLDDLLAALNPTFEPVLESDQPRLDEKAKVICPECSHEFTP